MGENLCFTYYPTTRIMLFHNNYFRRITDKAVERLARGLFRSILKQIETHIFYTMNVPTLFVFNNFFFFSYFELMHFVKDILFVHEDNSGCRNQVEKVAAIPKNNK